jgi:pyruvate,water dikinase
MSENDVILTGVAASPGSYVGICRVINHRGEIDTIQPGEIMVIQRTDPPDLPYMKRAGAFITNSGGRTTHAAMVARELGKPAVCGTIEATLVLKTGQRVLVDGTTGLICVPPALSLSEKVRALAAKHGVSTV